MCIDPATGNVMWSQATEHEEPSDPALVEGMLIVGDGAGILALDAGTGEVDANSGSVLWRWEAQNGSFLRGAPAVGEEAVYVTAGPQLFAIDRSSGERLWSFEFEGSNQSAPIVTADAVYILSLTGGLTALDPMSGAVLRRYGSPEGEPVVGDTTPTLEGSTLYVVDNGGTLHAYR
jgi:outer membrane protein assembly factor BamB